jgi:hypothetical protein
MRTQQWFCALDLNGDGHVTFGELEDWLTKLLNRPISEGVMLRVFAKFGATRSGDINLEVYQFVKLP